MKRKFLICLAVLVVYTGSSVLQQYCIKDLVDFAAVGNGPALIRSLCVLALLFLVYIAGAGIRPLVENRYKNQVQHMLRTRLISSLRNHSVSEFTPDKRSAHLSVLNNDVSMICQDYYMTGLDLAGCGMTVLFSIAALCAIHPVMAVIIFAGCLLMTLNPNLFTKESQKRRLTYTSCLKNLNQTITDFMAGIAVVRSYDYEDYLQEKMMQESREISLTDYRSAKIRMYINLIGTVLQCLQMFLIILVGILFILQGSMTAGGLLAAMQFHNVIAMPITLFAELWNTRSNGRALLEKFEKEYQAYQKEERQTSSRLKKVNEIQVKDLCYQVGEHEILKQISLTLDVHKKYLLVGKSGSGKSSLLRLIGKLDENYSGNITIGGQDLRQVSLGEFCRYVTTVFQDAYLFQQDLLSNITLNKEYPQEKISGLLGKLKLEKLWDRWRQQALAQDSIQSFSGGEKQRVALARALIRETPFYLMDEVTASVDQETRNVIEELLLSGPFGFLFVSHNPRPENLARYDCILLMEDGRIQAAGSYQEIKNILMKEEC